MKTWKNACTIWDRRTGSAVFFPYSNRRKRGVCVLRCASNVKRNAVSARAKSRPTADCQLEIVSTGLQTKLCHERSLGTARRTTLSLPSDSPGKQRSGPSWTPRRRTTFSTARLCITRIHARGSTNLPGPPSITHFKILRGTTASSSAVNMLMR